MVTPDLVREAEALIRALSGVAHASVQGSAHGIDNIRVTALPGASPNIAAHVRSALLAGLATPVTPARIHVLITDPVDGTAPRDRIRLLHDECGQESAGAAVDGARSAGQNGRPASIEPPPTGPRSPIAARPSGLAGEPDGRPFTALPRLVTVEVERPGDGRVVCRIAIAYGTQVHRADAIAVDLPGAAAHAAAQAAVRALVQAGLYGLELNGLREVEIAGRDYVIVALRRSEDYTRIRSGSATITGSPERSAAEATVAAARDMI